MAKMWMKTKVDLPGQEDLDDSCESCLADDCSGCGEFEFELEDDSKE